MEFALCIAYLLTPNTLESVEIGGGYMYTPACGNKDLIRFGAESPSRNTEKMIGHGVTCPHMRGMALE